MTEFEKWLAENKKLCKRNTKLALVYKGKHFPKALRMLEVAVKGLKWHSSLLSIAWEKDEALAKINQIAKEQDA